MTQERDTGIWVIKPTDIWDKDIWPTEQKADLLVRVGQMAGSLFVSSK